MRSNLALLLQIAVHQRQRATLKEVMSSRYLNYRFCKEHE